MERQTGFQKFCKPTVPTRVAFLSHLQVQLVPHRQRHELAFPPEDRHIGLKCPRLPQRLEFSFRREQSGLR